MRANYDYTEDIDGFERLNVAFSASNNDFHNFDVHPSQLPKIGRWKTLSRGQYSRIEVKLLRKKGK
jgi:hypothetical protein